MTVLLMNRSLLVKLYYQKNDRAATAHSRFGNFRISESVQWLQKWLLNLNRLVSRSLKTSRRRKSVHVTSVERLAATLEEGSCDVFGSLSVRGFARILDMKINTTHTFWQTKSLAIHTEKTCKPSKTGAFFSCNCLHAWGCPITYCRPMSISFTW